MTALLSRPYASRDRSACLAIFDSNLPIFFAPHERDEFCSVLDSTDAKDRPYLVLTRQGAVVACGGLTANTARGQASLAWGMVDRAFHGQGLGTLLTECRLALARATPGIAEVVLATSQHSRGFYERFGSTVSAVTPDGFAPGLDRCDMALRLTPT